MREVKGREALLASKSLSEWLPVQPASDHKVQDQPKVAFESENDPFSDPSYRFDLAGRAHFAAAAPPCEEGTCSPHGLELVAEPGCDSQVLLYKR